MAELASPLMKVRRVLGASKLSPVPQKPDCQELGLGLIQHLKENGVGGGGGGGGGGRRGKKGNLHMNCALTCRKTATNSEPQANDCVENKIEEKAWRYP